MDLQSFGFEVVQLASRELLQVTFELEDGEIKTSPYHSGSAGEVNNSIGITLGMLIVRIEVELFSEGTLLNSI